MNKIVLMLDEYSRANMTSNVYLLNQHGVKIIVDLTELIDLKFEGQTDLIVLEGLVVEQPYVVSDLEIYKSLLPLDVIYLGKDSFWLEAMKTVGRTVQCDFTKLTWEMLQGVVYHDSSFAEEMEGEQLDTTEAAVKLLAGQPDVATTQMAMHHLNLLQHDSRLKEQIAQLEERLQFFQNQNDLLDVQNKALLDGYKDLILESKKLNDNLQQYEIKMTQSLNNKTDVSLYANRPTIVYLKEYQELVGMDSLIETLVETLKFHRRKSVKVLRLLDNSGALKLKAVPKYYKVLGNQYELSDVFTSDYLCKTGDSSRVLQALFENKIGLDVLIVVDCTSWGDLAVVGDALFFGMCRDAKMLDVYNLSYANTFINGKAETGLAWDWNEPKAADAVSKFEILSNRPCIQSFLKFVDMYE